VIREAAAVFFSYASNLALPPSLPPFLQARGMAHLNKETDAPWCIMRVKAQDVEKELPMLPTTSYKSSFPPSLPPSRPAA